MLQTLDPMPTISDFLLCDTPPEWLSAALEQQHILLVDHANCEKKAASTALNLMFRYVDRPELLSKMSRLAREELRHFEQVLAIIQARGLSYPQLSAARYAEGLRKHIRKAEPNRLIDLMIVGALIEARSCERFEKIAPLLDEELSHFYTSLLKSEARHFQEYLKLGQMYADQPIDDRIALFTEIEAELISSPDTQFRFHSGKPA